MADDQPDRIIGADEMGNVKVGNPNMQAALENEAAKWQALSEGAIAQALKAKQALEGGTNEKGEEAPPAAPPVRGPLTAAELTARLMGERLIDLKRQPTDWEPRTVTFQTSGDRLIVGRRPLRDTVILFNASATVTIAAERGVFNTTLNEPRTVTLLTGATYNLETEGPVYGTASPGTTMSVIETYYDERKIAAVVQSIMNLIASGQIKQQV